MKYQQTPYYCGPASLQNALKVLRAQPVSQDRIAELAATTEAEGTDDEGLKRATLALGYGFDEIATDDKQLAWGLLGYHLLMGRPVVLCVDRWQHWVTAVGLCGSLVLLAEPARYPHTMRENGMLVVHRERFLRRWRAGRKDRPRYYGLAIGKNPA